MPTRLRSRLLLTLLFACLAGVADARAQGRVDKNVVYGMYSGLALLMDVHVPATPNGAGVVFVPGSAWTASLAYDAVGLKETQVRDWAPALLAAGYTVFAVNHRATPRFAYPAPVEDVQRAVRFVRHHAERFGVRPDRLAGIGGSSGGHLMGMVSMLGAPGMADDPDAVNRQPATIQCVVLRAAPTDLRAIMGASTLATAAVVALLERLPTPNAADQKVFQAASPIAHVKAGSPPALLLHGDADDVVPYKQSEAMEAALRGANVPVRLVTVPGGGHGSDFPMGGKPHPRMPDILRETVAWLDQHLKPRP